MEAIQKSTKNPPLKKINICESIVSRPVCTFIQLFNLLEFLGNDTSIIISGS